MAMHDRTTTVAFPSAAPTLSERDIVDAYLYLLGRLVVLRQEHLDFKDEGFEWNELVHRASGGRAPANPRRDVAYSEAWIAVDEHSSTLIEVPEIAGGRYTMQIVNLWGETLVTIDARTDPDHPAGPFVICRRGASVAAPAGTQRIDLPGTKARVRIRIACDRDRGGAETLQRHVVMHATGSPWIDPPVSIPLFTNDRLPGAEAFETAPAILASEPDLNPGTGVMQSKVRAVSTAASDSTERRRIDDVIRRQAWPALDRLIAAGRAAGSGPGTSGSDVHYDNDWAVRTVANLLPELHRPCVESEDDS